MVNLKPPVTDEKIKSVAALPYDARADLIARIKATNPFELFDLVEGKTDEIICPICGSGSHGNHNTGVKPKNDNGVWLYNCWAGRDFNGDLIKIVADANNLTNEGYEHFKVLAIAAKVARINIPSPADETQFRKPARNITPPAALMKEQKEEKIELPECFSTAKDNFSHFIEQQGDKWRGIPSNIWQKVNCGYAYIYFPAAKKELPAVVIPNDLNGLYYRSIEGKFHKNSKPMATTTVYLPEADSFDIVIVEGQINGLSILTAIQTPNFGIIASSGVSGEKIILKKIKQLQDDGKTIRIMLAGDNDSNNAGQKFNARMVEKLKQMNIPACSIDITKQADVDLNDILRQENGEITLAEMVKSAIELAQVELDEVAAEMEKDSALKEKIIQQEYQQRKQATQIKNQGLIERLKELQKEDSSPARNAEMKEIILELCEWNCNKRGEKISVKSSIVNYDLIFTYDPFVAELFGYEEFSQSDVLLKTPLWGKGKRFEKWTDSDDSNLRVYLRRTYKDICGENLYYDVFKAYSVQNSFNVVQNYFNNLPNWDGKERAETLFCKFLSVPDTAFTRAVTIKWLLAAVARIFYAGCNFQAALVLQGNQNIGKSYILEKLGGAWYGALIDNVDDSHAVDAIKNLWIVELKEMAAARKAEINAVKSFIERSADNHRAAYEKRVQTFKRHCVFAISVNDKQFLRDLTGNRRYWILESPLAEFNYIDGLTPEYVQQVWAEVFHKFKELTKDGFNDKILELPLEFKIQAENIAEKFTADDGLQREISAFLDIPILPPVLWRLLTKEEKRKFFGKNYIELDDGDWKIRREMLKSDADKKEFDNTIDAKNKFVRSIEKKFGDNSTLSIAVYGSYKRQETCAAEIYNEFYSGSDKRKQIFRINDVLANLENWELSDKQNKDFNGYGHQRKSYYRITNTDEKENLADDSATLAQDSNYYLDEVDVPF